MQFFPLRLIPDNTKIDFMGKKTNAFIVTLSLVILSFSILFINGLNYGIDFSGGILIEAKFKKAPDLAQMRHVLNELNIGEISLQNISTDQDVLIRAGASKGSVEQQDHITKAIKNSLAANFNTDIDYRKTDYVGPQVGKELIKNGIYATILSFLAIMCYIWMRFEWQYGVGLLIALIHDTIVCLGFMSLMKLEFNLTSIAALLTVIGYSVNDSVVIYDRIRENMLKYKKFFSHKLINISINETLSRTILTVTTTLLATLALILFAGEAVRSFSLVVFSGIIIGTYSSIYISAPILIYFNLNNNSQEKISK
jgi:preprotein translocase subunit SecF